MSVCRAARRSNTVAYWFSSGYLCSPCRPADGHAQLLLLPSVVVVCLPGGVSACIWPTQQSQAGDRLPAVCGELGPLDRLGQRRAFVAVYRFGQPLHLRRRTRRRCPVRASPPWTTGAAAGAARFAGHLPAAPQLRGAPAVGQRVPGARSAPTTVVSIAPPPNHPYHHDRHYTGVLSQGGLPEAPQFPPQVTRATRLEKSPCLGTCEHASAETPRFAGSLPTVHRLGLLSTRCPMPRDFNRPAQVKSEAAGVAEVARGSRSFEPNKHPWEHPSSQVVATSGASATSYFSAPPNRLRSQDRQGPRRPQELQASRAPTG